MALTSFLRGSALIAAALLPHTASAGELRLALYEVRFASHSQPFQQNIVAHIEKRCGIPAHEIVIKAAIPPFSETSEKIVASLLADHPHILIATTISNAKAMRDHPARTQPIVFYAVGDPVQHQLVASLSAPGHNMTGITAYLPSEPKRLSLLKESFPDASTVGLVYDVADVLRERIDRHLEEAKALGLKAVVVPAANAGDLRRLQDLVRKHRIRAFDVSHTRFASRHGTELAAAINATGLPAIYDGLQYVERGGLLSYEPKDFDIPAATAELICTILRSGDAGSIPVRRPTEFITALNLATARQLGITIPKWLLKRADVVIGAQAQTAPDH